MIDKWISEAVLAFLRLFIDVEWEQLHLTWWSGITLDDLCIRQDLFAALGAPMELSEGRIKRLHISGDWSYSTGIRPRIEVSGVRVVARVRPHSRPPRPPGSLQRPQTPSGASAKPQAPVIRSLLRRICCELTDLQFVAVDMLSDASQAASFGFNIQSISTETPVASRMQSPNLPAASAPGSVGGSSSSLGSAPGGAPRRNVTVDFRGAFYVPAVNARPASIALSTLAAAEAAHGAPPSTESTTSGNEEEDTSSAVVDMALAQQWLVVNPCTLLVVLEATGAEGAAPFGAAASALLPSLSLQASHWQLADMARLVDSITGVATRMQYMHLLPPELQAAAAATTAAAAPAAPAAPQQQRAQRAAERRSRVRAMWLYAVLAVRAQLRKPCVQAAHAARRARFASRYRTYIAACSLLHGLRKALTPATTDPGNHSAFSGHPAATLLPWLLEHCRSTGASPNHTGEFDTSTGPSWTSPNGANTQGEQWCGYERNQAIPGMEASVATGGTAMHGAENRGEAAEVWLADSAVVVSGATTGVACIVSTLLDAWERPECCVCEVERVSSDAWPHGAQWAEDSTHGGDSNRTRMATQHEHAAHSTPSILTHCIAVTMYPDRAARQNLLDASASEASKASKDGATARGVNPLERKSCGSVTSELIREGFPRDGFSGISGFSRAGSVHNYKGGGGAAPSVMSGVSAGVPQGGAAGMGGGGALGLWGGKVPARGDAVMHATIGDLVQIAAAAATCIAAEDFPHLHASAVRRARTLHVAPSAAPLSPLSPLKATTLHRHVARAGVMHAGDASGGSVHGGAPGSPAAPPHAPPSLQLSPHMAVQITMQLKIHKSSFTLLDEDYAHLQNVQERSRSRRKRASEHEEDCSSDEEVFEDPEGRLRRSSVASSTIIARTSTTTGGFVTPHTSQDLDSLPDTTPSRRLTDSPDPLLHPDAAAPTALPPQAATVAAAAAAAADAASAGGNAANIETSSQEHAAAAEGVASLRRIAQGEQSAVSASGLGTSAPGYIGMAMTEVITMGGDSHTSTPFPSRAPPPPQAGSTPPTITPTTPPAPRSPVTSSRNELLTLPVHALQSSQFRSPPGSLATILSGRSMETSSDSVRRMHAVNADAETAATSPKTTTPFRFPRRESSNLHRRSEGALSNPLSLSSMHGGPMNLPYNPVATQTPPSSAGGVAVPPHGRHFSSDVSTGAPTPAHSMHAAADMSQFHAAHMHAGYMPMRATAGAAGSMHSMSQFHPQLPQTSLHQSQGSAALSAFHNFSDSRNSSSVSPYLPGPPMSMSQGLRNSQSCEFDVGEDSAAADAQRSASLRSVRSTPELSQFQRLTSEALRTNAAFLKAGGAAQNRPEDRGAAETDSNSNTVGAPLDIVVSSAQIHTQVRSSGAAGSPPATTPLATRHIPHAAPSAPSTAQSSRSAFFTPHSYPSSQYWAASTGWSYASSIAASGDVSTSATAVAGVPAGSPRSPMRALRPAPPSASPGPPKPGPDNTTLLLTWHQHSSANVASLDSENNDEGAGETHNVRTEVTYTTHTPQKGSKSSQDEKHVPTRAQPRRVKAMLLLEIDDVTMAGGGNTVGGVANTAGTSSVQVGGVEVWEVEGPTVSAGVSTSDGEPQWATSLAVSYVRTACVLWRSQDPPSQWGTPAGAGPLARTTSVLSHEQPMHGMHTRGSGSTSMPGSAPPTGGPRSTRGGIMGDSPPGGGLSQPHSHAAHAAGPPFTGAVPRRTASAVGLAAGQHAHLNMHAGHAHAHAHSQVLARVRSGPGHVDVSSVSGSMGRVHHTRSASASLLHQLQSSPRLEAHSHVHETPMLSVSFSHHTKHAAVTAGPVAVAVSPSLLNVAQRCTNVASGVLPPPPTPTTPRDSDMSPECMLLAAADRSAQFTQAPTATVRIHSVTFGVYLPVQGGSKLGIVGVGAAGSQVCTQVAVAQCELRLGTVAHPACIARLSDDVRVMQDRMPQAHAFGPRGISPVGGGKGDSTNTPPCPPRLQPPSQLWLQCAHACRGGRGARTPIEALAMALTTPMHLNILDTSLCLALSQQSDVGESHMHMDSPSGALQPLPIDREPFQMAQLAPVATLGTVRANLRIPTVNFAPLGASLTLHELVAQVDQSHIDSADCMMHAVHAYVPAAESIGDETSGSGGARCEHSTADKFAQRIPPMDIQADISSGVVTVSRGGDYRDDACATVSWSHMHAAFRSDCSDTVTQNIGMHHTASPAAASMHGYPPSRTPQEPPIALVELSEFEITCLSGCIGDVMHEVHAYIPPRTVRMAFSHLAARLRLQAHTHALQSVTADMYSLRADATAAMHDDTSPMHERHASQATNNAPSEAAAQTMRVIGTALSAQENAQARFAFDGGHEGSAAVAEASSSLLRIAYTCIGADAAQAVIDGDMHAAPHMRDMHMHTHDAPLGGAVSFLILRGRVCAEYLTEILSGWPNNAANARTDGVSAQTMHEHHASDGATASPSSDEMSRVETSEKLAEGSNPDEQKKIPEESTAPNIALSLDIVDSELFVSLPARQQNQQSPDVATSELPQKQARRTSATAGGNTHLHTPPLPYLPIPTRHASQQAQEGACVTLHIQRWYILVHSELANITSGLSMHAVVAIRGAEQQAENLRDSAGCVHERVAAAGGVSSPRSSDEPPPMTPMTGFTFKGGPVGTFAPSALHAGSFKHSVTSSHLLSHAKSPLFATAESSGLLSFSSRDWPALDLPATASPRTLYTLDGTHAHDMHAAHTMLAAQRFVIVDFYGLRLDISTSWLGASWDPVANLSLPLPGKFADAPASLQMGMPQLPHNHSRHSTTSSITHVSQQCCALLEDFTVSLQTLASHDACAPCSLDIQCPSGVHAALSMVNTDVLVDCMHALHASAKLPHLASADSADSPRGASVHASHASANFAMRSPVATDNFDGAESDEDDGGNFAPMRSAAGAGGVKGGSVVVPQKGNNTNNGMKSQAGALPRWSQVSLAFHALQEVLRMRASLNIGHSSLALLTPPAPQACATAPAPCALGIHLSLGGLSASTSPPLHLPADYYNLPSARKHNSGLSQASIKSSFSEHVASDPALTVHLKPLTASLITTNARPANMHALCWYPQATPFLSGPPSARGVSPPADAMHPVHAFRSDAQFGRSSSDGNSVLESWLQGTTVTYRPFLRMCAARVTACEAAGALDGMHAYQGIAPPVDIVADTRKGLTVDVIVQGNTITPQNVALSVHNHPAVSTVENIALDSQPVLCSAVNEHLMHAAPAAFDYGTARSTELSAPQHATNHVPATHTSHGVATGAISNNACVACVSTGAVALLTDASCFQNAKNVLELLAKVAHRPEHTTHAPHASFRSTVTGAGNVSTSSHVALSHMHADRATESSPKLTSATHDSNAPSSHVQSHGNRFKINMHTQHIVVGVLAPVHADNASQTSTSSKSVAVVVHAYAHASVDCSPEEIMGTMHVPELRASICHSGACSSVLEGKVPLSLRPLGDTFGAFGLEASCSNLPEHSKGSTPPPPSGSESPIAHEGESQSQNICDEVHKSNESAVEPSVQVAVGGERDECNGDSSNAATTAVVRRSGSREHFEGASTADADVPVPSYAATLNSSNAIAAAEEASCNATADADAVPSGSVMNVECLEGTSNSATDADADVVPSQAATLNISNATVTAEEASCSATVQVSAASELQAADESDAAHMPSGAVSDAAVLSPTAAAAAAAEDSGPNAHSDATDAFDGTDTVNPIPENGAMAWAETEQPMASVLLPYNAQDQPVEEPCSNAGASHGEHACVSVAVGAVRVSTGAEDLACIAHIAKSSTTANWSEPNIVSTCAAIQNAPECSTASFAQLSSGSKSSTLVDAIAGRFVSVTCMAPMHGDISVNCSVAEIEWTLLQRHSVGIKNCESPRDQSIPTFESNSTRLHHGSLRAHMHAAHALSGHIITPIARLHMRNIPLEASFAAYVTRMSVEAHVACIFELELLNAKCQAWDCVIAPWPLRAAASLHPKHIMHAPESSQILPQKRSSGAEASVNPLHPSSHSSNPHASPKGTASVSEFGLPLHMHDMHDTHASDNRSDPGGTRREVVMHVSGDELLDVVVSDSTAHAVHALSGLAEYAESLVRAVANGWEVHTPPAHTSQHLVATEQAIMHSAYSDAVRYTQSGSTPLATPGRIRRLECPASALVWSSVPPSTQMAPIAVHNYTGLDLAVSVLPCHHWPLAPSQHIPPSAADPHLVWPRPCISPLIIPAAQTHALFPAALAAKIAGSPHACARFDWPSCSLEVSVLQAPPEATSTPRMHDTDESGASTPCANAPVTGPPIARFSPLPCFPLEEPVATAAAACITRGDGAAARVRFTAVARIGAHACAEIAVHAGVSFQNNYTRTLFVRPAPPPDTIGTPMLPPPPRMHVAIRPGGTAYLPAACIAHGGIQLCMETSTSPTYSSSRRFGGGLSPDSNSWSRSIAIVRRRASLSGGDSARAWKQSNPERMRVVRSAQHALSVRQFSTSATVAGAPPEVHVAVSGACTIINTLPVHAAVLLEGSDREGTVEVSPFASCDVPVAGCLNHARMRVTLDQTEQSEAVNLAPGKHTLIHCRHHACGSCTAMSTIIANLSVSDDSACIVLYAHACVQNATPLGLHVVIANAPSAQAEPQAEGGSDATRSKGVRPASVAVAALATILTPDCVTVRLPYMHAVTDSRKRLPMHWDPAKHVPGLGGAAATSANAEPPIPRARKASSMSRSSSDLNRSPRSTTAVRGDSTSHTRVPPPTVSTIALFDTHATHASSLMQSPADRAGASSTHATHAWSPPGRSRSPAVLHPPNAAASPLPPSPHLEHLWPLTTTTRMQEADADVSMNLEDSIGLADVLPGHAASSSSGIYAPQRAISLTGSLTNSAPRPPPPQTHPAAPHRGNARQYSVDSSGGRAQHAKHAAGSSGGHASSSSINMNSNMNSGAPTVLSGAHTAPILLSLPPSASLSTSDTLIHVARLDDSHIIASHASDDSMLTLHALRSNTVPLHSKTRSALGRTFLSDDSAPGEPSSHTLRVPLQPPAMHAAMLQVSLQAIPSFSPFSQEHTPVSGICTQHPAADVLAGVPALKFAFVAPMHVVANRMHAHATLERPLPSGSGIYPLTHQHAPPDSETLLMCPQDSPPVATPAFSIPPPTVRLTVAAEGTNHTAQITLTQLPPVATQLTTVSAAPVATTVQTCSKQLTPPMLLLPRCLDQRKDGMGMHALQLPKVLVTTLDTFQDTHATAHIMNLSPHNLRAYPHSSRASSLSPAAAETPHNIFQDVPAFSRRPFLWDAASAAALAEAVGSLSTDPPPLPPVKMHSDIGITFEVNVGKVEGWPVRVADLMVPQGGKGGVGRGGAAARWARFGTVRISADGAMAADARAVAEGLQIDVKRPRPWSIEIVLSSLQAHGAAAIRGVNFSPRSSSGAPEATTSSEVLRRKSDSATTTTTMPPDVLRAVHRSTEHVRSVVNARLDLAGAVLSVVHAKHCREVMVARMRGVHAQAEIDDEGWVSMTGELRNLRATNSDPEALFPVVLAAPVQQARTTQGWSDITGQPVAHVVVAARTTAGHMHVYSAKATFARAALQLEADLINSIFAVSTSAAAAMPPQPPCDTASAPLWPPPLTPPFPPADADAQRRKLDRSQREVAAHGAACMATGAQDPIRSPPQPPCSLPQYPLAASPPRTPPSTLTLSGVALSRLQITFSFAAPKRKPVALSNASVTSSSGAPVAMHGGHALNVNNSGSSAVATGCAVPQSSSIVGRAVSALVAAAGISAANLVVPAFEGPPVAMVPAAVAAEWLEELHSVSRKMAPWLIAAMDILGSPAQLFSLLYGSLSDLLALPARNLRLALAFARANTGASAGSGGGAAASGDSAAALRSGPASAARSAAALAATLSTSGLRVAFEAGYAMAAAGRRSASALHQLTASMCPAPFQPTLDPVEFVLTFPALSVQSCARAITSRPLWALPASSLIGVGTVATGAVFMPLSIIFGYSELACATCMHAMHPPTLNALLRIPRPLYRAAPIHAYHALVAAAYSALQPLLSNSAPLLRIHKVIRVKASAMHASSTMHAAHAPESSMHAPRSAPVDTAPDFVTNPLIVLTSDALYVMHLPPVDTELPEGSGSVDATHEEPRLLVQLPLACVTSACMSGMRVELSFVWPHAYDRDRSVSLSQCFVGELSPITTHPTRMHEPPQGPSATTTRSLLEEPHMQSQGSIQTPSTPLLSPHSRAPQTPVATVSTSDQQQGGSLTRVSGRLEGGVTTSASLGQSRGGFGSTPLPPPLRPPPMSPGVQSQSQSTPPDGGAESESSGVLLETQRVGHAQHAYAMHAPHAQHAVSTGGASAAAAANGGSRGANTAAAAAAAIGGLPRVAGGFPIGLLGLCCTDEASAEELCVEVRRQLATRRAMLFHYGRPWWLPGAPETENESSPQGNGNLESPVSDAGDEDDVNFVNPWLG